MEEMPDVEPWFSDESEGQYSYDPEDGYAYDTGTKVNDQE